jgi:hypothetical protein
MKVGTQIPSSTGGTITVTKRGLIHTAGNTYSGRQAQDTDVDQESTKGKNKKKQS